MSLSGVEKGQNGDIGDIEIAQAVHSAPATRQKPDKPDMQRGTQAISIPRQ
jgi:hypothetical protein